MIRVAIVDDHPIVRAGLKAVLAHPSDIDVVGCYEDARSFFAGLSRTHRVDVVLLDVSMPGTDGFDVLRRLRERREPPAVIQLSMHPARSHAQRSLDLGARGYLTKDASDSHVVEAVRTVAWGGMYFLEGDTDLDLQQNSDDDPAPDGFVSLSEQEMRVMRLVYMGLSTKEISQDLDVSPKTVSTYKSRIMTKLGVGNVIELIRYAESVGFGSE